MAELSKSQLTSIISALEGERRNPNTKDAALKAIGRHAERLGLSVVDILSAGAGLLDGRLTPEAFRAELEQAEDGNRLGDAEAEQQQDQVHGLSIDDGGEVDPLAMPEFLQREPVSEFAEESVQLVMPKRNGDTKPHRQREGTKEALVIAMLRRPQGATIAQIMHETGWLAHTVRGASAGALKKKCGLTVTSEPVNLSVSVPRANHIVGYYLSQTTAYSIHQAGMLKGSHALRKGGRRPARLPAGRVTGATMPKPTLQQRLVDALVATGRGTPVASRSHKYVTLKRPDGSLYFVGRNGALRFGRSVSDSVAAPDEFKRRLLAEPEQ